MNEVMASLCFTHANFR